MYELISFFLKRHLLTPNLICSNSQVLYGATYCPIEQSQPEYDIKCAHRNRSYLDLVDVKRKGFWGILASIKLRPDRLQLRQWTVGVLWMEIRHSYDVQNDVWLSYKHSHHVACVLGHSENASPYTFSWYFSQFTGQLYAVTAALHGSKV